jgi:hypothetical protein
MSLSVTNYGDNPFVPGAVGASYTPDQLIAGDLKLVTQPITLTGGAALKRGTILGQITRLAAAAVAAGAGGGGANTGNGTITLISLGPKAQAGNYVIKYTDATHYTVTDPAGEALPAGVNGAYADNQINFTSTAGGTAFVAGDGWSIAVGVGSGSFKQSVATATDGSQYPNAVLVDDADATGGDVAAGAYEMGEFNLNAITFDASWSVATLTPILRNLGIFLKSAVTAADPT